MKKLLGVLLLLSAGCGTVGPLERRLEGSWEWVQSTGGIAGLHLTPQSEGYVQQLVFRTNGELEIWRSGKRLSLLRYRIEHKPTMLSPEPADVLVYDEPFRPEQLIRWGRGDTLYLIDVCFDCYVHTYVRRR
jgi:hypothetical protein|nr:MAG: hypothetical protein KatS3mg041_1158 [Bacteroidota bacterium]